MGKKISIGSWAYVFNQKEEVSFHKILHGLQDLKLDGVELGSFGKHPTPKSHPTKADRLRLKKEVEDHGLGFSGIAPDLWSFKLVSVEDPAPYLAAFLGYCVFAQDLGIKLIRVDAVEVPSVFEKNNIDPKLGFDRAVKAWNIACKMAADHGLQVSWEFEPGFAFNKPSEIVAMIDAVRALGNNNFGAMYDTCHALLHNLKGRVNHVHLIDSDGSLNEHATSTHNPFGTGHLNFDEYIPALLAAGIPSDWWCIDLCFWPDAWDVTADSMKYLGNIKKKYAAQGA
jgi:sugar phosphate isomerase/epimerase